MEIISNEHRDRGTTTASTYRQNNLNVMCLKKAEATGLKWFATLRPFGKQYITCHGKAFKHVWMYISKIPYIEGCVTLYLSINPLVSRAYR